MTYSRRDLMLMPSEVLRALIKDATKILLERALIKMASSKKIVTKDNRPLAE